jgi:hypothetical protein
VTIGGWSLLRAGLQTCTELVHFAKPRVEQAFYPATPAFQPTFAQLSPNKARLQSSDWYIPLIQNPER